MQATFTLRRFPIRALVMALIAAAVLLLGVAAGYGLKSLAGQGATTVTVTRADNQASSPIGSSQGLFGDANNNATVSAAPDEGPHHGGPQ